VFVGDVSPVCDFSLKSLRKEARYGDKNMHGLYKNDSKEIRVEFVDLIHLAAAEVQYQGLAIVVA
jgi:hypothetical protein